VLESAIAVSDLGDAAEGECIATTLRGAVLPVGAAEWARVVDPSVPVRLTE
jgi:hypothetical protein